LKRRVLVSLPEGIWNIIDNDLKGLIGDEDSEVIRNMIISYLIEKGYLLKCKKGNDQQTNREQITSELDVHDSMITALTEILEEKGQLNPEEWEKRVQKKLHSQ
jgi:metal-responsive CopG/Arc/MetJ family transcriptional regulator